jgi:hypothetical protein
MEHLFCRWHDAEIAAGRTNHFRDFEAQTPIVDSKIGLLVGIGTPASRAAVSARLSIIFFSSFRFIPTRSKNCGCLATVHKK